MKRILSFLLLCILCLACNDRSPQPAGEPTTTASSDSKQLNAEGEQLFKIKCMQCHLPNKDFAGPALAGVEKRWKDKQLLYAYIRNSQEVIAKDKYAAELFKKWNEAVMLPFPDLTNAEIDAILEYCNQVGIRD